MSKPYAPRSTTFFKPQYTRFHYPDRKVEENIIDKLFLQVEEGNIEEIKKFILNERVSLNVKNNKGESVLHGIIRNEMIPESKKTEIVKFLIMNGAPTVSYDKMNITPLHLASKFQLKEIAELLLNNGADPNARDNQNMTPVHYAVQGVFDNCKFEEIRKQSQSEGKKEEVSKMTQELIGLIRDLLVQGEIKQYLAHFTSTINEIPTYYNEDYKTELDKTKYNIQFIISQEADKTDVVKEKISNEIIQLKKKLDEFSETKLQYKIDILPKDILPKDNANEIVTPNKNDKLKQLNEQMARKMNKQIIQGLIGKIQGIKNDYVKQTDNIEEVLQFLLNIIQTINAQNDTNTLKIFEKDNTDKEYGFYIKEDFETNYPREVDKDSLDIELIGKIIEQIEDEVKNTDDVISYFMQLTYDDIPGNVVFNNLKVHVVALIQGFQNRLDPFKTDTNTGNDGYAKQIFTDILNNINGTNGKQDKINFIFNNQITNPIPRIVILQQLVQQLQQIQTEFSQILLNPLNPLNPNNNLYYVYTQYNTNGFTKYNPNDIIIKNEELSLSFTKIFKIQTKLNHHMIQHISTSPLQNTNYILNITYHTQQVFYYIKFINDKLKDFDAEYPTILDGANKINELYKKIESIKVSILNVLIGYYHIQKNMDILNKLFEKIKLKLPDNNYNNNLFRTIETYLQPQTTQITIDTTLNTYKDYLQIKSIYGDLKNIYDKMNSILEYIELYSNSIIIKAFTEPFNDSNIALDKIINRPLIKKKLPNSEKEFSDFFNKSLTVLKTGTNTDIEQIKTQIKELYLTEIIDSYVPINYDSLNEERNKVNGLLFLTDPKIREEKNITQEKKEALPSIISLELETHMHVIIVSILEYIKSLFPNLQQKIENYKEELNKTLETKEVNNNVIYVIVLKLVEKMLKTFIKGKIHLSNSKFMEMEQFGFSGIKTDEKIIQEILQNTDALNIYGVDYGFTLEYNELIGDILTGFDKSYLNTEIIKTKKEKPKDVKELLTYSSLVGLKSQEPICNRYNISLIKLLLDRRGRADMKDAIGNTPLVYAIKNQNTEVIKLLLKYNAGITEPTNITGFNPYTYLMEMFNEIINNVIGSKDEKNLLNYLPNKLFEQVSEDFLQNKVYNNKIPVYSDNLFKSALSMLNHHFYFETLRFKERKELIEILNKNGFETKDDIPILKNINKIQTTRTFLQNQTNLKDKNNLLRQDIKKLTILIKNLEEEKTKSEKNREKEINEYIKSLKSEIDKIKKQLQYIIAEQLKINQSNYEITIDIAKKSISRSVPALYNDIFNKIIHNKNPCDDKEMTDIEINAYLELWKSYLDDNTKVKNPTHIHLALISLLRSKTTNEPETINTIMMFYKDVLIQFIIDYEQLPLLNDKTENYALYKVLQIIEHIIKHYVMGQLLNSIRKTLAKHFISANPYSETIYRTKDNYSKFINGKVNEVIKGELVRNVLCVLPRKVIGKVLGIPENEGKRDNYIKMNLKTEFENLNNILIGKGIDNKSTALTHLKEYVYNYFSDYAEKITKGLKEMFDGYLHNIVEEYKILEILQILKR